MLLEGRFLWLRFVFAAFGRAVQVRFQERVGCTLRALVAQRIA